MNEQMPIMMKILRHNEPVFDGHTKDVMKMEVPFRQFIPKAIRFDVQVASDIYWKSTKDYFPLDSVGPLKMPYPNIWMEWKVPSGALIESVRAADRENGKWINGLRCGAYLSEVDGGFDMMTFIIKVTGEIVSWTVTRRIRSDQLGANPFGEVAYSVGETSEIEAAKISAMTSMLNMPAVMALGLINCKNVEVKETGQIGLARTASEKRRKIPARKIKYHTIMLPGGGSKSDGKGGHRASAVHQVRGHFKTFTAEKPLLGRHVGTYWWGWQVRGNAENGIVVSDYKVGVK